VLFLKHNYDAVGRGVAKFGRQMQNHIEKQQILM